MSILLGAIADDFTGATDLASTLVKEGVRVTQVIGVPDDETEVGDAQAVIVALKSRTAPVSEAVSSSLDALAWLRKQGAQQIFFKYCSTFDSTTKGNIGPVADVLMSELECKLAFVCPAFPENARTVYQGHLFVGEQLLSESPMKDHPLTPMRDANVMRLMNAQSQRSAGLVPLQTVRSGPEAIATRVADLQTNGHSYAVIDAIDDQDLRAIGEAAAGHPLITGGSAVAKGLPENFRARGSLSPPQNAAMASIEGRALVLAGSCSTATRGQIEQVNKIWPLRKIDVNAVAAGAPVAVDLIDWASEQSGETPVLIYASSDPGEVAQTQEKYGLETAGALVEKVLSEIAVGLAQRDFRRIVVAGGETSGAVVSALKIKALRIGPEIDPGVPWTESLGEPKVALALKSGNFGGSDFFVKALAVLE